MHVYTGREEFHFVLFILFYHHLWNIYKYGSTDGRRSVWLIYLHLNIGVHQQSVMKLLAMELTTYKHASME